MTSLNLQKIPRKSEIYLNQPDTPKFIQKFENYLKLTKKPTIARNYSKIRKFIEIKQKAENYLKPKNLHEISRNSKKLPEKNPNYLSKLYSNRSKLWRVSGKIELQLLYLLGR